MQAIDIGEDRSRGESDMLGLGVRSRGGTDEGVGRCDSVSEIGSTKGKEEAETRGMRVSEYVQEMTRAGGKKFSTSHPRFKITGINRLTRLLSR